jgi:flagellar biosynthesis/type III secretory pathway M-ring protein FliF/YscJ
MTAAFQTAGLKGARLADGQILVPKANLDAYLVALDAADALPADFDDDLDQVAADSHPFASRQQTEMGYRLAEQKKLARILSGMKGIETASVQYAEIKKPGFPPTHDIRAVVAVRAEGKRQLTYEEIEAIRDTVAGYVAGLDRAQVTVSDLNACRAYPGGGDTADPATASYAARAEQARLEEEFRAKIQSRLAVYPGAIVGVNVQLAEASEGTSSSPAAARRRLTPALVSASIDLPKSYFTQVWRERNAEASAIGGQALPAIEREVKQTVEQAVLALLPPPAAQLRGSPQVVVTSYEDLPRPSAPAMAAWRAGAGAWLAEPWFLMLAASLLAAGAWLLIRRRRAAAALGDVRRKASGDVAHDASPAVCASGSPISPGAKPSIQLEICRAIQENPQAAAETLQRWLSKAA